jgi:predicted phosphodiesterase
VIGAVHGDTTGSPDRKPQWLAGQAIGRQQVGAADILFSGHFHTLRVQDLGGGRTWIMCPAMDNGSPFYRHKRARTRPRA